MHEYKVVPAPSRAVRVKGLKTTGDRFAHQLTEVLNLQAGEGWEYLRTETLPCDERKGLTGTRSTTQVMMIFRREIRRFVPPPDPVLPHARPETAAAPLAAATETWTEPPTPGRMPQPETRRAEPVFRPGALFRPEGERPFPPLRADRPADGPEGER